MSNGAATGFDRHYVGVSPQLLARVRQNWSALGLDLDVAWRDSIATLPGFAGPEGLRRGPDSWPVDLLMLFDQGCCWANALRVGALALRDAPQEGRLTPEQLEGLVAVSSRLREAAAAVRALALAGLARPGMQIARSVSEDVELALALLVRRKLARAFVACRTPEDAADFWRRHVAGGRAFRLVAQALYRFGLDYTEDSEYVRWRREVLVFLGSAVHTSFIGVGQSGDGCGPLGPAAQECLYFATVRLQELCAYALVLGDDLRADLEALAAPQGPAATHVALLVRGGGVVIDQMRWLTEAQSADAPKHARGRAAVN
ncbi:MAG: hypothetical protein EA355_13360 [Rhodobacteraceae bacterium]|nr:MAG: hypothetical protein EA355_13360 [Paracoccaceae bacterium]